MIYRSISNPCPHSDRNWPTHWTKFPETSKAVSFMLSSAVKNSLICTWGKPNNHSRVAQPRRATTTGQDSAVHLLLEEKGHCEDNTLHILDREDRWCGRGVKEASMLSWKNLPLTEVVDSDISSQPLTTQCCPPFPGSFSPDHRAQQQRWLVSQFQHSAPFSLIVVRHTWH